jgi:hypothetical protein
MAVCAVTRHAEHRTRERVGIPKKAVRRAAARAITQGVKRVETDGGLRKYLDYLYYSNGGTISNIIVYGDKVYLFNVDTLVTVLTIPTAHAKQAARLMRKRRKDNGLQ